MTMVEDIRELGRAVEDGQTSLTRAVEELCRRRSGLTATGAEDSLKRWRTVTTERGAL